MTKSTPPDIKHNPLYRCLITCLGIAVIGFWGWKYEFIPQKLLDYIPYCLICIKKDNDKDKKDLPSK